MPFVLISSVREIGRIEMDRMRLDIVKLLSEQIPNCPKNWIRPIFLEDMIGRPTREDDGAKTTLVILYTGLFSKVENPDEFVPKVTKALAELVANWLGIDAECVVGELNPLWSSYVEIKKQK